MPHALPVEDARSPGRPNSYGARRLTLSDFRSYASLDLDDLGDMIALVGDNGAGKTNVLEALSLLSPGRGLRRAELSEFARANGAGGFAVSVEMGGAGARVQLGAGVEPGGPLARKFRIAREAALSARAFGEHVRVVWLTPAQDGLFAGPPAERRRFLDRLTLSLDADHGARVNALERALRGRNRLLEERGEAAWLDALEREAAELAVAVAAARGEAVRLLSGYVGDGELAGGESEDGFPRALLSIEGEIDRLVADRPALEAEDRYRFMLRENRARDAAAGRALIGPQSSDLFVRLARTGAPAAQGSTGEQKALLVGLILAQARLVRAASGLAPLVLLDEIAAHFDPRRRAALYERLARLDAQVWMSGADEAAFSSLPGTAQRLRVTPGRIEPLASWSRGPI
ncbi:DNA replication/repair protein RecF [Methylocella sp.]|uniref:DNA replication/repair protein RecF n=1 Tax=Methylocella sp. TaxID=1978226 RepID=UPI0037849B35